MLHRPVGEAPQQPLARPLRGAAGRVVVGHQLRHQLPGLDERPVRDLPRRIQGVRDRADFHMVCVLF